MKKEPWMRTCSECGKAMAQGYVVGGGDEYYCSDECLHKHYTEEEWEEMSAPVPGESDPWEEDEEIGNDFNYWTEWGPGDEVEDSVNEAVVADEYDPYSVASYLLDNLFDRVAYSPEWWEEGYGAPDLEHNSEIEEWAETWENKIAAGIEKGIKSGRIEEDDDWKTFIENVKNSEVGKTLFKARKDLLKIFEKIEFGEELDESSEKIDNGMIKGVLVDVDNEKAEVVELKPELDEYYKLLNCDMIEIATRKVGRKVFDIVCDEEGTFVEDPKISAINNIGRPMLVGNILVLGQSTDGKENGLTPAEVKYVMDRVVKLSTHHRPEGYPMLTQVEYA